MKRISVPAVLTAAAFCCGFGLKTIIDRADHKTDKVTGIGGVFFKSKDPKKLTAWYQEKLGLNTNPYGATFEWYEGFDSTKKAQTQWTPFPEKTGYFAPSTKDFMINYRVGNLKQLAEDLKKTGVTIVDTIESFDYGKFLHIMDPEGNKVQLWQATD